MTDLHCAFCGKRQSAGGSAWCVSPFKDQLHVFDGSHPLDRLDYGTAAERAIHKTQTIGPVAMKSPTHPDAAVTQADRDAADKALDIAFGEEEGFTAEMQRLFANHRLAHAAQSAPVGWKAEDIARAMHPDLFSDNDAIAHMAASPRSIWCAREDAIEKAQGILDRLAASPTPEPEGKIDGN